MKRFALFALAAAAVVASAVGCTHAPSMMISRPEHAVDTAATAQWTSDVRGVVQDGDWILTRSYSAVGDAITTVTSGEDVSHAQIYDAEHDTVIESTSAGVHETPLADVIAANHHVVVVRARGMTAEQRSHMVKRARSRIGDGYDYTGLFGVDDPNRLYCSELVWWAAQGEVRTGDRYTVIAPADLLKYGDVVYHSGARENVRVAAR